MPFVCTLKEWQTTKKPINDFIVAASDPSGDDSWKLFPIGMPGKFHKYCELETQIGSHDKTVFCAINANTDKKRRLFGNNRQLFATTLRRHGIHNVDRMDPLEYFLELPKYKFVISPEGNGIDCHRHYEALMAGCIPIIEDRPLTRKKYGKCPVLFTHNYSEITVEYLEKKYDEMLGREYDFSCLFISSYSPSTVKEIIYNSNWWMSRRWGVLWYKN